MSLLVGQLLHSFGVALWIGGIVAAALAAAYAPSDAHRQAAASSRTAVLYVATPGLLLAWIGGLMRLLPLFGEVYAKAGWMHGKLTIALVVTGLTGMLTGHLRKAAAGSGVIKPGLLRGVGWAIAGLAAAITFLAVFRPGT